MRSWASPRPSISPSRRSWTAIPSWIPFVLIIIATGIGTYITNAFAKIGINLPVYIGGMIVALIIRNVADAMGKELPLKAIDVAGNTSLNVFLGIALMTLKLWQLAELALPIVVTLAVQTLLMYLFASFVVFRVMGADYEAAVMTAAFCGFGMGATPNAMANMLTIKNQYGPAPKAFFVVPWWAVCSSTLRTLPF